MLSMKFLLPITVFVSIYSKTSAQDTTKSDNGAGLMNQLETQGL